MTNHISARVAWHMDGWNGRICSNPAANTYCIGQYSYPGTKIGEERNLEWEQENRGQCCSELSKVPPCIYSINAFGSKTLTAEADPPAFFGKPLPPKRKWELPPSTICIWPYEEMYYRDGIKKANGNFDYDKRREYADQYFSQIEKDRSLIFYYANYSNPFSEDDAQAYVIVGVSRVKRVGQMLFYENCTQETKERFGGGFIWQRNITSHYPDEGFRIPYHLYLDKPDVLEKILFVPDNQRKFKYATRIMTDDDALALIEYFIEVAAYLKELGDTSDNWSLRLSWLHSLVGELWRSRGLYPGLAKVFDFLDFKEAVPLIKGYTQRGEEKAVKSTLFQYLDGEIDAVPDLSISADRQRKLKRQWQLQSDEQKHLLRDLLPRFDLSVDQLRRLLADDAQRGSYGFQGSLHEIAENPYVISEQYVGDDADDIIPFSKIDHGVFPSPELGGEFLAETNDWRRLRALCVEYLKREQKHVFSPTSIVLDQINRRLSFMPEWKRHQYTLQYFKVDQNELSHALTQRQIGNEHYLYLKYVHEDERLIERQLRLLAQRPSITFKVPMTEQHWFNFLSHSDSPLQEQNPDEYRNAIHGQVEVCQKIFPRSLSVLSGAAGTGKTTVIKALIQAIKRTEGEGASFQLLAPTGKAADRLREATGQSAATIHSFLARRNWINTENMTYRRTGGRREEGIATFIIDEASMLDLDLIAALFRAIKWETVKRLIFVGDPNQLPPIGRGRVFADIIDWLHESMAEGVGVLTTNIRQMEGRLKGEGESILKLASLYTRSNQVDEKDEVIHSFSESFLPEDFLLSLQEGGDIDKDLRVLYWQNPEDLVQKLTSTIVADMEQDTGESFNPEQPYKLWNKAFGQRAEYQQVISPYRGEQFGTVYLNEILQQFSHNHGLNKKLAHVALFDKVMQIVNSSKARPMWAYNATAKKSEQVEVFNGELGFVKPHGYDTGEYWKPYFYLKRFQVIFSRKSHLWVEYPKKEIVEDNLELAYAISVHKSQGSEFERVYFILPKEKTTLLSRELFYTGVTRARRHCTLLVQGDISPLLRMRRPEKSHLVNIDASLFDFHPLPLEMHTIRDWKQEWRYHKTLADIFVRSKSEVIIANMLTEREIPFQYEVPLFAEDGTFYLPDFTITWNGKQWYWEHLGRLDNAAYRAHWKKKNDWYRKNFPHQLIITEESEDLSGDADMLIREYFS
ncbi:ATP-dependent DNA helicase [Ktedonobacter racemifer]|nr:AAA family ATPase [Ktedonobacter racemifer]